MGRKNGSNGGPRCMGGRKGARRAAGTGLCVRTGVRLTARAFGQDGCAMNRILTGSQLLAQIALVGASISRSAASRTGARRSIMSGGTALPICRLISVPLPANI